MHEGAAGSGGASNKYTNARRGLGGLEEFEGCVKESMGRAGGILAVEGHSHCRKGKQSSRCKSFLFQGYPRIREGETSVRDSLQEQRGKSFQEQAEADASEGTCDWL